MATKQRISEQLRKAVLTCGKTRYRISLETGISQSILSRFVNQGAGLSLDYIDLLCECIGARLVVDIEPDNPVRGKSKSQVRPKSKDTR